jgi:hypothetical protein
LRPQITSIFYVGAKEKCQANVRLLRTFAVVQSNWVPYMSSYRVGQLVTAAVVSILPFGVFARLEDGTLAYIRRRVLELDADEPARWAGRGSLRRSPAWVRPAHRIEPPANLRIRYNSPKPPGPHNVQGTVQSLYPGGIFVRIQAGISGFVPLNELASWQSPGLKNCTLQRPRKQF